MRAILLLSLVSFAITVEAATPSSGSIPQPASLSAGKKGGTAWTGPMAPGIAATSGGLSSTVDATLIAQQCLGATAAPQCDVYQLTFSASADFWQRAKAAGLTGTINVQEQTNANTPEDDIDVYVFDSGQNLVGQSNNAPGTPETEQLSIPEPTPNSVYYVVAYYYTGVPAGYSARADLSLELNPVAAVAQLPIADPKGLQFSASLGTDVEYYASEPLVTVDGDGTIYTCGPDGSAYPAADYGQASLDGGDQFNRLGDPTTGRMGLLGGGDCAMATGVERNAQGNYQLAYSGLSGVLSDFTVSTSPDKGQTLTNLPSSNSVPLDDRQWLGFADASTVYLTYKNEQLYDVIHQSTDGGLVYGPATIIAPVSGHVGNMRTMTKDVNPAHNGMSALYFPYAQGNAVALAISLDAGATWNNCTAVVTQGAPDTLFPSMDHDDAGNIYVAYTDQTDYNTYLSVVPAGELSKCKGGSGQGATITAVLNSLPRVRMNRGHVATTVMPWVAAGGVPGRAAVSFYGSSVKALPADTQAPHVWDVYVSQTLDALDASPAVAQVKATTHPMHYDQICVSGTLCATGGDRSLDDFFSIVYNKKYDELDLVFFRSGKKPGDGTSVGSQVAGMSFIRQIGGPTHGGGTKTPDANHVVLRQSTADPVGDAYGGFSSLVASVSGRYQIPALDLKSVAVDSALDFTSGKPASSGGFTVTMHVADLSAAALNSALSQSHGQSLLWMFYYWTGFEPHAAAAIWDGSKFTFGTSTGTPSQACAIPPGALLGCDNWALGTAIDGTVDQVAGTIKLTIPLSMLNALADVAAPARSPSEVPARAGDRIYSAAAYTFVNLTGTNQALSQAMMPVDNTAAMDFLIPKSLVNAAADSSGVVLGGSLGVFTLLPLVIAGALCRRRIRQGRKLRFLGGAPTGIRTRV